MTGLHNKIHKKALLALLALAALVRAVFAFYSVGFDHPNEAYRLLEPLAAQLGYSAHPPWEWTDSLLSRWPVFIHLFLIKCLVGLGILAPLSQIIVLKLIYAMLSLSQVYCAWVLVLTLAPGPGPAPLLAAALVALWPELIYASVRLMDYSIEASVLAIAILCILSEKRPFLSAIAGALLGCLFFVRYQTGLHLISLILFLLWGTQKQWNKIFLLVFSYGLVVAALAFYEGSGFLLPFRNYIHFNWIEGGAARIYGADPWHRYVTEIAKFFGVLPFLLVIPLFIQRGAHWKLLFLAVFPAFVHSLIEHKEGRFVYGCLYLLIPAVLVYFSVHPPTKSLNRLAALLLICGFFVSTYRVGKKFTANSLQLKAFQSLSIYLAQSDPDRKTSLVIYSDPIFNPASFFVRQKGILCYRSDRDFAKCPANLAKPYYSLALDNQHTSGPVVWRMLGWKLIAENKD